MVVIKISKKVDGMTNEELVRRYQEGDKEALNEIIQENKGIVNVVARRYIGYCISTIDLDDLIQEGYIGLIKAAERYDFNNPKKAAFMTYALYWVRQRISKYGKGRSRKKEDISISLHVGDNLELMDTLQEDNDYICEVEERIYLKDLSMELYQAIDENLTMIQREVIELKYGINIEQIQENEICKILKIESRRFNTIERSALHKLRTSKWGRMKWLEIQAERI